MKRRIPIVIVAVLFALFLSGCQCSHEWAEADCITPKTCRKCGETEGVPAAHTWVEATCDAPKTCAVCGQTEGEPTHQWTEANYQDPKTCKLCGATEGEPLISSFEKHGVSGVWRLSEFQEDDSFEYVTSCWNDRTKKTTGIIYPSNYRIFTSDETHEAKEGYEWRAVDFSISYDDENAQKYGWSTWCSGGDYYRSEECEANERLVSEGLVQYTVNFHGVDYPDCLSSVQMNDSARSVKIAVRIPVGYDGTFVAFYDGANNRNLQEELHVTNDTIFDYADENTVYFLLN